MVLAVDDSTHDEINIKRLLNKCEEMAKVKSDDVEENWRLGSYVCSLEKMINQLNTQSYKPSAEIMSSYSQRLSVLKGHINIKKNPNPLEKVTVLQSIPKCSNDSSNSSSKEIEHLIEGSVNTKLREELFGSGDDGLRRRTSFKLNVEGTSEMDDLLKYHHNMQEKIADNMLSLARNIKEQSLIAGNIIRNDSLNVEKSTSLADKNITQLKVQSEKLQENTRKTCQCWIWILVVVVLVVFVNMVMLMKVTKKRV